MNARRLRRFPSLACVGLLVSAASASLYGCGDDETTAGSGVTATPEAGAGGGADTSTSPTAEAGPDVAAEASVAPVSLRFKAVDNSGAEFKCGATNLQIAGLTDALAGDLRLYVHDVSLLKAGGRAVPLALTQDAKWQHQNVALLDFEDATAECAFVIFGKAKTAETNREIKGTPAEGGPYVGVRFTLGVPPSLNHSETATAPSPLSSTGMDHGVPDGRQFLRASFYSTTTGATGNSDHNLIMLRSVCNNVTGDGGAPPADAEACTKPNRPVFTVERPLGYDPAAQEIVLDVGKLFAGFSKPGTADATDLNADGRVDCFGPLHAGDLGPNVGAARCGSFYPALGMAYATGRAGVTQTVFSLP